jgi:hypothetical protein
MWRFNGTNYENETHIFNWNVVWSDDYGRGHIRVRNSGQ